MENLKQYIFPDIRSFSMLKKFSIEDRLLTTQACYKILQQDFPNSEYSEEFKRTLTEISNLSNDIKYIIFSSPFIHYWNNVIIEILGVEIYKQLPEVYLKPHLRELRRIILSANVVQKVKYSADITVSSRSEVCLPLSNIVIKTPRHMCGKLINIVYDPKVTGFTIKYEKETITIDEKDIIELPIIENFVSINNFDIIYQLIGRVDYEFEELTADKITDWENVLSKAFLLIKKADINTYEEIKSYLKVIIPVVSKDVNVHLSSTDEIIAGTCYMSYTSDYYIIAEALVHEFNHNKLNIILKLDPIFNNNSDEIYFSPWRKDPRPLSGILHGCFAFFAVSSFWYNCLNKGLISTPEKLRIQESLAKRVCQVANSIETVVKFGKITNFSLDFIQNFRQEIMLLYNKIKDEFGVDFTPINLNIEDDFNRWKERNPNSIYENQFIYLEKETLPASVNDKIKGILGVEVFFISNLSKNRIMRKDELFDKICDLSLSNRTSIVSMISMLSPFDTPATNRLLGMCFYSLKDFGNAKKHFQIYRISYPDDLDNLHDIAFCERHLGNESEFQYIMSQHNLR